MTPEEFFKNLDLTAIVRKSTEKEKPTKLEDGDAEKLCSIVGMNTENACCVLNEVYEKYKELGYYPKELLQAVYFVIYRDCYKLYNEEKAAYATAPDHLMNLKRTMFLVTHISIKKIWLKWQLSTS